MDSLDEKVVKILNNFQSATEEGLGKNYGHFQQSASEKKNPKSCKKPLSNFSSVHLRLVMRALINVFNKTKKLITFQR